MEKFRNHNTALSAQWHLKLKKKSPKNNFLIKLNRNKLTTSLFYFSNFVKIIYVIRKGDKGDTSLLVVKDFLKAALTEALGSLDELILYWNL